MKAQKLLSMTILLMLFVTVSSFASDATEQRAARKQLKSEISSLFDYVPFTDLLEEEGTCQLRIIFRINEDQEMDNIIIEGNNDNLVNYAKTILKNNRIKANPLLEDLTFGVDMKFIYRT
jgi:hypothetical protein